MVAVKSKQADRALEENIDYLLLDYIKLEIFIEYQLTQQNNPKLEKLLRRLSFSVARFLNILNLMLTRYKRIVGDVDSVFTRLRYIFPSFCIMSGLVIPYEKLEQDLRSCYKDFLEELDEVKGQNFGRMDLLLDIRQRMENILKDLKKAESYG